MELSPGERLGIGRGAEVFACGEGRVLKLLRNPEDAHWLTQEAAAQRAAIAAGIRAPQVFDLVEHDGRPGLLMERIEGPDGLTLFDKEPWRVWEIGKLVGRLHTTLSVVTAPADIPSMRDFMRHDISTSDRVPAAARQRLLKILEGLPESSQLCHMDFHPGNVMVTADGPVIIDFASARRGDHIADHVKSLILLEASSPVEMGLWERMVVRFGRGIARLAYKRGFGRLSGQEAALARRWRPVVIGQRLAEGIPEERGKLLRMLSRSLREAEAT